MKQLLAIIMAASISLGGCVCLGAGWVYEFDGVGAYITTANTTLAHGYTEVTVSAWIKPNGLGSSYAYDGVIGCRSSTGWTGLSLSSGGTTIRAQLDTTGGALFEQPSTMTAGVWQHVAMTWCNEVGDNYIYVYINGVQVAPLISGSGVVTLRQDYQFEVGSDKVLASRRFNGQIHAARIYNRALTAAECRGLYKAGGGRNDFGALSIVLPRADDQSLVYSLDRPADTYSTGDTVVEVRDASPSGSDGSLKPSVSAGPVWSADRGGAYDFDGSADYIKSLSSGITGTNICFSVWVNHSNGTAANDDILDMRSGDNRAVIRFDQGFIRITDGSGERFSSASTIGVGWHHLGVCIDDIAGGNADYSIYIDGALDASGSGVYSPSTGSGFWYVGNNSALAAYFNGRIDDVAAYDTALTSNQVYNLSQGIAPTNTPVLHYPFTAPSYSITSKDAERNYGEAIGGVTIGPAAIATPAP